MQEAVQQLNQYLEQMLGCVEPPDTARFGELNREYSELMDKTFSERDPLEKKYDTMRNNIAHALWFPDKKDKWLPPVREFLDQARG